MRVVACVFGSGVYFANTGRSKDLLGYVLKLTLLLVDFLGGVGRPGPEEGFGGPGPKGTLCYVILCCDTLCYAMLCQHGIEVYAMLRYVTLRCVMLF